MKVLGLIVEYNPFHKGHIYHINKSKSLVKADYTVAIMSGNFVQRGEPAIINKWKRSEIALEYGVDLVIELPFVYSCQSADYFAKGALKILSEIGVTDLCFGSEIGDIEVFKEIAYCIKDHEDEYNHLVKENMKLGIRYPDACNKALNALMNKEIRTPNDLLGLSYVKEIVFNNYDITPHCFKRTNDYHSEELAEIASATSIRKALLEGKEITSYLPHSELYKNFYTLDMFYPYLRYVLSITSKEELQEDHMVDEGIENLLIENIKSSNDMETFIQSLLSKRYTRPRIQRMIIHILMNNKKEDIRKAMDIDYIRILSMNEKGREYLNIIKKDLNFTLVSNISRYSHPALDIELKAARLLSLIGNEELDEMERKHIPLRS